jgi:hypothetical protein
MRTRLAAPLLLLAGLASSGCARVTMADDIDIDFDFAPLIGPSDDLHSPYVKGASVRVYARSTDSHEKMIGWTIESSDPTVFALVRLHPNAYATGECTQTGGGISCAGDGSDAYPGLAADFHAAGPGSAVLTVRDGSGAVLDARPVEVAVPDHAVLLAHGALLIGHPEQAPVDEPRILAGGTATFMVEWHAGATVLSGNGVLSVDAPVGLAATPETTSFLEDREWLALTPSTPGAATITVYADGTRVEQRTVTAVAASEVDHVTIAGEDEGHAHKGDWLVALAEAWDGAARSIFGIDYTWNVDGVQQFGAGDLYRYEYEPGLPRVLSASFAGMSASASIHAGAGFVDSTNNIGCSLGGGRRGAGATALFAAPALALLWRRRRPARGR